MADAAGIRVWPAARRARNGAGACEPDAPYQIPHDAAAAAVVAPSRLRPADACSNRARRANSPAWFRCSSAPGSRRMRSTARLRWHQPRRFARAARAARAMAPERPPPRAANGSRAIRRRDDQQPGSFSVDMQHRPLGGFRHRRHRRRCGRSFTPICAASARAKPRASWPDCWGSSHDNTRTRTPPRR